MRAWDTATAERAERAWRLQTETSLGRFGLPFHVVFGAFWCLVAAGPPVLVELGMLPLCVVMIVRLPFVWRGVLESTRPIGWCWGAVGAGAWQLFMAASLLWTTDAARGGHELGYVRWLWVVWALWPILHRRELLAGIVAWGVVAGGLAQVVELIGLRQGVALFPHPPSPDPMARVSGWWHQPAVGGAVLVTGIGMMLGPALLAVGARGWWARVGLLVLLAGLVLTGSRGSWVVCAVLVLAGVVVALAVPRAGGRVVGRGALLTAVAVGLLAIGGVVLSPAGTKVRARVSTLLSEAGSAGGQDLNTDTGGRIVAARAALDAGAQRPLWGLGAGSFPGQVRAYAVRANIVIDAERVSKLQTAHNTWLNALATLGGVGVALLAASWLGALSAGLSRARWAPGATWGVFLGSYSSGPGVGLLAMLLVSAFETVNLNMSTMALWSTLVALCAASAPAGITRRV